MGREADELATERPTQGRNQQHEACHVTHRIACEMLGAELGATQRYAENWILTIGVGNCSPGLGQLGTDCLCWTANHRGWLFTLRLAH